MNKEIIERIFLSIYGILFSSMVVCLIRLIINSYQYMTLQFSYSSYFGFVKGDFFLMLIFFSLLLLFGLIHAVILEVESRNQS